MVAFTYITLNIIFVACMVLLLVRYVRRPSSAWWITLVALLGLTLLFDNLAIWAEFFRYAPDKILGIHLGLAPIEDFFYAMFAVILVPTLWKRFAYLEEKTKGEHGSN